MLFFLATTTKGSTEQFASTKEAAEVLGSTVQSNTAQPSTSQYTSTLATTDPMSDTTSEAVKPITTTTGLYESGTTGTPSIKGKTLTFYYF
jgi:hypothetical protein